MCPSSRVRLDIGRLNAARRQGSWAEQHPRHPMPKEQVFMQNCGFSECRPSRRSGKNATPAVALARATMQVRRRNVRRMTTRHGGGTRSLAQPAKGE